MSTIQQWTWSGTCLTGCTGTATLTATAIADGAPLTGGWQTPLLTADYQDSQWSADFALYFRNGDGISVVLPISGVQLGYIDSDVEGFRTFTDGTWRFTTNVGPCPPTCNYRATGIGSLWVDGPLTVAIPEPATAWLLGAALLLALAVQRWVRR